MPFHRSSQSTPASDFIPIQRSHYIVNPGSPALSTSSQSSISSIKSKFQETLHKLSILPSNLFSRKKSPEEEWREGEDDPLWC